MIPNLDFCRRFVLPTSLAASMCLLAVLNPSTLVAQDSVVQVEPAQTKIEFSLGSTLHTVHGTFTLKRSTIRFEPGSGKISGAIVVDATSGESGNGGRDARMHREILESAKFPEIVFTPTQIKGAWAAGGASKVEDSGRFRLHGKEHDVSLPVEVVEEGPKIKLAIHFVIPYVEWGLKNPSNFFLHASDKVEVDIHATGHVETTTAPH
jgi:polyisoprenoid-binding protein YceI